MWPSPQDPYPIYDQNLFFPYTLYMASLKICTLFMTIAADTVALNLVFEGLFMVLLIIMKN